MSVKDVAMERGEHLTIRREHNGYAMAVDNFLHRGEVKKSYVANNRQDLCELVDLWGMQFEKSSVHSGEPSDSHELIDLIGATGTAAYYRNRPDRMAECLRTYLENKLSDLYGATVECEITIDVQHPSA